METIINYRLLCVDTHFETQMCYDSAGAFVSRGV
jgi:hypothetical protein